jgi:hypothetical protein
VLSFLIAFVRFAKRVLGTRSFFSITVLPGAVVMILLIVVLLLGLLFLLVLLGAPAVGEYFALDALATNRATSNATTWCTIGIVVSMAAVLAPSAYLVLVLPFIKMVGAAIKESAKVEREYRERYPRLFALTDVKPLTQEPTSTQAPPDEPVPDTLAENTVRNETNRPSA